MPGPASHLKRLSRPVVGWVRRGARKTRATDLASPWLLALSLIAGPCCTHCASAQPKAFVNHRAQAERDYTHGRYWNAAAAWRRAAQAANRPADRQEALYRAAAAQWRAGDLHAARNTLHELLGLAPRGARAARACYDLGLIEFELGHEAQGAARLRTVIAQYPRSGLSVRALDRLVRRTRKQRGLRATLDLVDHVRKQAEATELGEHAAYTRARLLHESGDDEQARRAYLEVASDYPYPQGAYWDDALWYAADLERKRGRPRRAIQLLNSLLAEAETAHFQGSYTRTRYPAAQFRIAEIHRDDLDSKAAARKHFRKVFSDYPTSLLRDDALWQEALVAHASDDEASTCNALRELIRVLPESRYAACVQFLCPRLDPVTDRPCRRYIRRSLEARSATGSLQSSK